MNSTSEVCTDNARLAGQAFGDMILSFFGTVWLAGACLHALPDGSAVRTVALGMVIATGVALLLAARSRWRRYAALPSGPRDPLAERRRMRQFHLINAGQWIAILLAVNILRNLGLDLWQLPAVIGIVGVHFLLLAPVLQSPRNTVIGAILIVAALACPWLGTGPLLAAAPAATGLTLWLSVLWPRHPAAPRLQAAAA